MSNADVLVGRIAMKVCGDPKASSERIKDRIDDLLYLEARIHGGKGEKPQYYKELNTILDTVSDYFNLPARSIIGPEKYRTLVIPRQMGMVLSRELTQFSLSDIGRFYGNRDHTTVLHAQKFIALRCQQNSGVAENYNNLKKLLSPSFAGRQPRLVAIS